jgi:type I restriction enzyme M protein
MANRTKPEKEEPLEKKLWKAADKLRKNMDAAEYKHVALGLIFLKYISDAFEELYANLKEGKGDYEGADPEDRNEYIAEKVFYVPRTARWQYLQGRAKLPSIGKDLDDAMTAIEKNNPKSLKGVLPIVFAQERLDKTSLGGLIDLFSTAVLGSKEARSKDILGNVFEYFLGQFALAEGKKGGQFYTPGCVVKLLTEMLEPYEGRVFDPCCGSGGMFVQSEKFIERHQDHYRKKGNGLKLSFNPADRISIYGQESNLTTWRLCKMNLAIRGIDGSNVKWNNEGSFLNDAHKDLKADYILANPPFNDSDWSGDQLRKDARWLYGTPPAGNANYAWIQHFLFHLAPKGTAGFVLSKGSLTTKSGGEFEIRKGIIDDDLLDCVVNLPTKLFLNTQIPACLWFLKRNKTKRSGEVLFVDARNRGVLLNRKNRMLTDREYNKNVPGEDKPGDIEEIVSVYHSWKSETDSYSDIQGFCKSVKLQEIRDLDYVITPGRYVGLAADEDDFDFTERFTTLKSELEKQIAEEKELNRKILKNLSNIIITNDGK